VQIVGRATAIGEIFDHLSHDAWRHGAIALTRQLDPAQMLDLSQRLCVFSQSGFWMLVQSRHPELLQAIHRGDALLTRLESEWRIDFHGW
jgi:hypothetical protein